MLTVEEIRANHFEIKIRGWSVANGMMYSDGDNCSTELIEGCCDPQNRMLWTGDKDADGKDIYCKDIVSDGHDIFVVLITDTAFSGGTGFNLFQPNGKISYFYGGFTGSDYRVIGNIYENPELWPVESK